MSKFRSIFAAAAFFYLFLAPFFFHPDLKIIFYLSQFLSQGVFDIYGFIAENQDKALLGPFVYPPLTYFLFGILFIPVKLLAGSGFASWLAMGNDAVSVPHIFRYLFAMKLPLISVHLITGYFLTKLVEDKKDKLLVLTLWFFNPISIYVVGLMGQFDGIPTLLLLLALIWAGKNAVTSSLFLGLGAALKSFPLLFLPFLAILGKSWRRRLAIGLPGIIVFSLFILPFARTPAFYQNALASGLSQRIFQPNIGLGFGEQLLLVPAALILLFLLALTRDRAVRKLFNFFLAVPLIILIGSHFHPQWAVWSLPFLVVAVVRQRTWFAATLFFIGWIGTILFFDDKFLTWGLFSPMDPGVLFLPTIASLAKRFTDPLLIQSLFHTLMSAAAVFIIWKSFLAKRNV